MTVCVKIYFLRQHAVEPDHKWLLKSEIYSSSEPGVEKRSHLDQDKWKRYNKQEPNED